MFQASPSQMSSSSSNSSLPSLDVSVSSNNTNASAGIIGSSTGNSSSVASRSPAQQRQVAPDFYIIRVTQETDLVETDGESVYNMLVNECTKILCLRQYLDYTYFSTVTKNCQTGNYFTLGNTFQSLHHFQVRTMVSCELTVMGILKDLIKYGTGGGSAVISDIVKIT